MSLNYIEIEKKIVHFLHKGEGGVVHKSFDRIELVIYSQNAVKFFLYLVRLNNILFIRPKG